MVQRVLFASSNNNKFLEAREILSDFDVALEFANLELREIQSDSLEEIAKEKAGSAFGSVNGPVIVEDDGLFIDSLNGFPGQYSSFVFRTIGNDGILKLLDGSTVRSASFRSIVAYSDGKILAAFEGRVEGRIAAHPAKGGWGYDPIFVPERSSVTFAELGPEKNRYSHRKMAMTKFAEWLVALRG